MKSIFTLLLLIPVMAFCQTKGDTKIIVKPSDTTNLFNRVVSYLYEQGYSIQRKDSDAGFLLTDEREVPKRSVLYKIKALVKDGIITFSSSMKIYGLGEQAFSDVFYTKGDSFYRMAWDIVDKIAKQFGAVSYSK